MFFDAAAPNLFQASWSFPAAFLTVLVAVLIGVPIIRWAREKRYDLVEGDDPQRSTSRVEIGKQFQVPEVEPSMTSIARPLEELYHPVSQVHEEANRLQRTYHDRVARCVICLALAITALGLSLTIFHGDAQFKVYASAIDVVAMALTLQQWWSALAANHQWVATRIRAELLRQWAFLTALSLPTDPKEDAGQVTALFGSKDKQIEDEVVQTRLRVWWRRLFALLRGRQLPPSTIEERISAYWVRYRAECVEVARGAISPDDIAFYLSRRPIRQLAWFRLAQARLQDQARSRGRWLALFFAASVILAVVKAAMAHKQDLVPAVIPEISLLSAFSMNVVAMALLTMTILSTAATALYLSRNDRSLLHRYATQERRIKDWLAEFVRCSQPGAIGSEETIAAQRELLKFEDLMIDEMIDWVHISSHDTFELTA